MALQIDWESLEQQLAQVEDTVSVDSDEDLLLYDRGYIRNHNDKYTELLEAYVDNANKTLKQKKLYKDVFFWGCVATMGIMLLVFILVLIIAALKKDTLHIVTTLTASTASFASVFIVLPKIIAQYLFSTTDEGNMADIIKNMQEYDKSVRENMKR